MSDDDVRPATDETAPIPGPHRQEGTTAGPPPRRGFRDRMRGWGGGRAWGLRAVLAVALAALILGGLGGFALGRAGHHDHERSGHGGFGRVGPGWHRHQWRRFGGPRGRFPGQGGQFMPPGPAPSQPGQPGQPTPPSPATPPALRSYGGGRMLLE